MLRGGTTYRILKDHLGSPRLVVNASSGAIAQRLDYDEWGNTTETGTLAFQPFGFAGGLWDRDTNLVRFGARDYDPTTGRWTTKDASRFGGGLNFYAYANDDPVNYIDVDGHNPALLAGVLLAVVYLALASPTHDGSVMMVAPIMAAPTVGEAAGGALAGLIVPAVGAGTLTCGGSTATGFLGHKGYELANNQAVRNEAAEIGERAFSGHALDQMQNRGILPSVVQNALENGVGFSTRAGTAGYYDAANNVSVIVNSETGMVVTVRYGGP
jgi:RHS repeat-associated protein